MESRLSSEQAKDSRRILGAGPGMRGRLAAALMLIGLAGLMGAPDVRAEEAAAAATAESAPVPSASGAEAGSTQSADAEAAPKEGEVHLDRPVAPDEVRKRRGKHVQAKRQRDKWWKMARTTLFKGIDLTPEQDKKITEIIAEQKKNRTEYSKADIQLAAARAANDLIRARELRNQVQTERKEVKSLHEVLDTMRPVLTEKQQAIFDTNRAQLIADGQKVRKKRMEKRAQNKKAKAEAEAVED